MLFTLRNKKIWVAGHRGLAGSALVRRIAREGCDILTVDRAVLDLRDQAGVASWVKDHKPDAVILAAATVGGIGDNAARPADFLYDNLAIQNNAIRAAFDNDVEKFLLLGSSCIYPKEAPQPIKEESLLSGSLEPTNEAYALAKIAGLALCRSIRRQYGRSFIAAMPCNLYGPGDRFDAQRSHVIPALILKMHQAKLQGHENVSVWGSGRPLREFLYVDDLAEALVTMLCNYDGEQHVNIGSGTEIDIKTLSEEIRKIVDFQGFVIFDSSKPDGTMRKVLDSSAIRAMGWKPVTSLGEGLRRTYDWYLNANRSHSHAA